MNRHLVVFILLLVFAGCSSSKMMRPEVYVPIDMAGIGSTISAFKDEGYIIKHSQYGNSDNVDIVFEKTEYKIWAWFENGLCYHIIYSRKDRKDLTDQEKMLFLKINFRGTPFRGDSVAEDPDSLYNLARRRGLKVEPPSPSFSWRNTTPPKIECMMIDKNSGFEKSLMLCQTYKHRYGKE